MEGYNGEWNGIQGKKSGRGRMEWGGGELYEDSSVCTRQATLSRVTYIYFIPNIKFAIFFLLFVISIVCKYELCTLRRLSYLLP